MMSDSSRAITACLEQASQVHAQLAKTQLEPIRRAAETMTTAIESGHKIIWFGNGGSATQSQHMAAELVGRFAKERRALPSISLTENMASVTAIANDYQYDLIFVRQLEGLARPGDVAIGLSTSGASRNVVNALRRARELGVFTIGLTGGAGGEKMQPVCDVCLVVPSPVTARIQEAHLTVGHILCGLVEEAILSKVTSTV